MKRCFKTIIIGALIFSTIVVVIIFQILPILNERKLVERLRQGDSSAVAPCILLGTDAVGFLGTEFLQTDDAICESLAMEALFEIEDPQIVLVMARKLYGKKAAPYSLGRMDGQIIDYLWVKTGLYNASLREYEEWYQRNCGDSPQNE